MNALDDWFDQADVDKVGRDQPSVRVNWPSHINAWLEPDGYINGEPIAILSLGSVEFRRPLRQLRMFLEAGVEALRALEEGG